MQTILDRVEIVRNQIDALYDRLNELVVEQRLIGIAVSRAESNRQFARWGEECPSMMFELCGLRMAEDHYALEEARFNYKSVDLLDKFLAAERLKLDEFLVDQMLIFGWDADALSMIQAQRQERREQEQHRRTGILEYAEGFREMQLVVQDEIDSGNVTKAFELLTCVRDDLRSMCQQLLPQAS